MGAMIIYPDDLPDWPEIPGQLDRSQLVEELNLRALAEAPALAYATEDQRRLAMAILRGAAIRWHERVAAGGREVTTVTSGPFSVSTAPTTEASSGKLLWKSEIDELRDVCASRSRAVSTWVL